MDLPRKGLWGSSATDVAEILTLLGAQVALKGVRPLTGSSSVKQLLGA